MEGQIQEVVEGTTEVESEPRVEDLTDEELELLSKDEPEEPETPEAASEDKGTPDPNLIPEEEPEKKQEPPKQPSQEEYEKLLKQLEHAKMLRGRHSQELGELRKQLREANARLQENLKDVYDDDPVEGTNRLLKIQENERRIKELDEQDSDAERVIRNQQIFFNFVRPEETNVEEMAETLERVGIPQPFIQQFKADPFRAANPESLVFIAKLAQAEKLILRAANHIKQQQSEIETLRKKPEQVLTKVQQAMKQKPQITGSAGSSSAKEAIRNLNPVLMSDAELEESLRNLLE